MSNPGSTRSSARPSPARRLPGVLVVLSCLFALLLAVTAGCGSQDRAADPDASTEAIESSTAEVAHEDYAAVVDAVEGEDERPALRSLGYAEALAPASEPPAPRAAGSPKKNAPTPSRKAPDTGALSELDYRNAQNSSQRANEALDYLGAQSFDAPVQRGEQSLSGAHFGDDNRPLPEDADGEMEKAVGFEEAKRLRDRADAHALDEKLSSTGVKGGRMRLESRKRKAHKDREGAAAGGGKAAPLTPAQQFQAERRTVEGLAFQPGSGYWANTYVPGDPVLRWLESRLEKRDPAALQAFARRPLLLESASRQPSQPFDPPTTAALSVFVQADRRGLEREERMLVQVGLQGANRRGGLRPAMTVGVVLDARGALSTEAGASMRALLEAFLASKDVGDRFSLTLAGRPSGQGVGADEFRHGPLSLAIGRLFEPNGTTGRGEILGITEALEQTATALQRGDDPDAPLGSSMVLLVTSQPLGPHTEALVGVAHRSAVAGVPVSVVAVGEEAGLDEIERVALAGQGNRRLLQRAADAEALVDRELSALSRVIARALRLNIRLAPGVKLVDVVGADRLDAAGAQQVRVAEQSIDRRLARNLGIETDRGEDEDGIQIVIPTFQSGDSHAVLLDVVASGPGPIADVTVRYKDLVYLRNSVARANLTLARDGTTPGPLERNVVKNYLAVRLAGALKQAGRSLLEGGDDETIAVVQDFRALLDSLQTELPSFRNDTELRTDSAMLGEYLALLETGVLDQGEPRRHLADSLQLSGYFKTVPRSSWMTQTARRQ